MNILLLEDNVKRIRKISDREFYKGNSVMYVRQPHTFASLMERFDFDKIILDHDLDNRIFVGKKDYWTGLSAIELSKERLIENKDLEIVIHSWNPFGSYRMYKKLKELGMNNIKYRPCRWPI